MSLSRPLLPTLLALTAFAHSGCTNWHVAEQYEGWALYVQSSESVASEEFVAALEPAFATVESLMGEFEDVVKVHAWHGGVEMQDGAKGRITTTDDGTINHVPGIGPARVRAFHARGDGGLFSPSGVFVGTTDVGTAVHELVHARLAEEPEELPLWFEEGFAMILGDGTLHGDEWVVDGLACWPWRELREQRLDDVQLARLLEVSSGESHSVRDNVLVHFVGWAIVFDLYREVGELDWRKLLAHYRSEGDTLAQARRRLDRTLDDETPSEWLELLKEGDTGQRLAASRGTWKLHSRGIQRILLRSLRNEEDAEVQASLAVNALATAGQVRLDRRQSGWMWRAIFPVLRTAELEDPDETSALRTLYRAYRYGNSRYDTQAALDRLSRFWED